jgi:hypothetical protein
MIEVAIWFSNLTPMLFMCLIHVGFWFVAFLIARILVSPTWDFTYLMDYLTTFHVGWDEFVNMLIELLCWSTILFL